MSEPSSDTILTAVKEAYGARARQVAAGDTADCCGESRAAGVKRAYYSEESTGDLPDTVVSYGCGNPTAIAGLRPGEVVLDLGSGAGLDCFLSARQVGPTGRAIGLDMTDDMLALAERNKAKLGVENVEFVKGEMEHIPLPDATVDVIISNCVINLSPDKDAVFREAFRVLRPGGRVHVSDVVLLGAITPEQQADLNLWAGCASGALHRDDYAARLAAAGFMDVQIEVSGAGEEDVPWRSALVNARRPGGGARTWPDLTTERIEFLAPAGLETAACCVTDAAEGKCC
ncbi:MAG: arsenite methyltransferase [Dehalococcoidia bacterium]